MGILSKIFGNSDNAEKLVDGATKGLDKMFFTKEEKADANQKMSEWYLRYLEATQPQNVSRRFIAIIVTLLWAGLVVAGVALRWLSYEMSDYVFKVLDDVVTTPFMLVISFYFARRLIGELNSKK